MLSLLLLEPASWALSTVRPLQNFLHQAHIPLWFETVNQASVAVNKKNNENINACDGFVWRMWEISVPSF